jgi:hypothetical protein
MVRRRQEPSGFNLASIIQLLTIPLATGGIILIGFYYTTNSTLTRYGDDIKTIKTTVDTKVEADTAARAKIRDDFLASQIKTAEGIAKLDTRLAVAETNQKIANDTLSKIADTLQKATAMPTGSIRNR